MDVVTERSQTRPPWLDLAILSTATFKAARTIVRDDVKSFILQAAFIALTRKANELES